MGFFGFKNKREVEEEKREAAQQAVNQTIRNNYMSLSNISKGSQVNIAIPYFDVFDPRLADYGVPVSVHGTIVYSIDDMDLFNQVNKTEQFTDETFKNKLRSTVTKYVKGVVTNAPTDAQIPLVQIERKILEISELVQNYVTPKVEKLFGITVRSLDITSINVDKDSRGYRELKALTADLEKENVMAKHNASLSNFNLQNDLNQDALRRQQEMNLSGQEQLQQMQLDNQRETMRIQREEMQRASRLQTEQTFLGAHQANLNAGMVNNATDNGLDAFGNKLGSHGNMFGQTAAGSPLNQNNLGGAPQMPGLNGMPQMPQQQPIVQYMVGVNGQQAGPFNWQQLQQLVQQGQLTQQTYVWKQGMSQWASAGQVAELAPLFQNQAPGMPGMPPSMPGM